MYVTYTDDDRIIISEKRLTKRDIERFRKQGVDFLDYDDIEYEKHGNAILVDTRTHVETDDL